MQSRYETYLEILLAMENDRLGLDLTIFNINLVTAKDNGNIFTNSNQITMPIWNILISDTRCHVEHNDSAFA